MSGGETRKTKKPPRCWNHRERQGGETVYTDYGFEMDGIEYATIDEAYEDDD